MAKAPVVVWNVTLPESGKNEGEIENGLVSSMLVHGYAHDIKIGLKWQFCDTGDQPVMKLIVSLCIQCNDEAVLKNNGTAQKRQKMAKSYKQHQQHTCTMATFVEIQTMNPNIVFKPLNIGRIGIFEVARDFDATFDFQHNKKLFQFKIQVYFEDISHFFIGTSQNEALINLFKCVNGCNGNDSNGHSAQTSYNYAILKNLQNDDVLVKVKNSIMV